MFSKSTSLINIIIIFENGNLKTKLIKILEKYTILEQISLKSQCSVELFIIKNK